MSAQKRTDFDRMWNTDNANKRIQFRNRMKAKLDQIHMPHNEENARAFYLGELKAAPPREEYRPEFEEQRRSRGPPRGPPRGGRGRGPPRRR